MKKFRFSIYLIFPILFLSCCGNYNNKKSQESSSLWTKEIKEMMLEGCKGSVPINGMTEKQTIEYCNCILEKTMVKFPNPDSIGEYLPDTFVKEAGIECLEKIGITETHTKKK